MDKTTRKAPSQYTYDAVIIPIHSCDRKTPFSVYFPDIGPMSAFIVSVFVDIESNAKSMLKKCLLEILRRGECPPKPIKHMTFLGLTKKITVDIDSKELELDYKE